jgi:citrate lyase subunit beta/citryl-CoA lyase
MTLRSLLFVPGDDERKLAKAWSCAADALILDLEDAVAPARKRKARETVAAALRGGAREAGAAQLWVRINPLDDALALEDLAAVVAHAPDGIVLPKASGPACVERLSFHLDALEVQAGVARGSVGVIPVATETASAPFRLGGYAEARLPRLRALTWGAEDLSAALGAAGNLDASGAWALTYRIARSLTLLAAHAAGVPAIDTIFTTFRDEAGLRASSSAAFAEGFCGRMAIHPAQVDAINESFSPSDEQLARAHRVVAAFRSAADAGAVGLDGTMLDLPHLKQAQAMLDRRADRR